MDGQVRKLYKQLYIFRFSEKLFFFHIGYDCKTPVCLAVADEDIRSQLLTVDEKKIRIFESDPCGMVGFYKPNIMNGVGK